MSNSLVFVVQINDVFAERRRIASCRAPARLCSMVLRKPTTMRRSTTSSLRKGGSPPAELQQWLCSMALRRSRCADQRRFREEEEDRFLQSSKSFFALWLCAYRQRCADQRRPRGEEEDRFLQSSNIALLYGSAQIDSDAQINDVFAGKRRIASCRAPAVALPFGSAQSC